MTEDIPFDRSFDLKAGIVKEIAPQVRALCAGNSGPGDEERKHVVVGRAYILPLFFRSENVAEPDRI